VLQGQVYALAFGNNTLFTAGQDTSIRVWQLNEQAGIFVSQVCACLDMLTVWFKRFKHLSITPTRAVLARDCRPS
jgi:hypothetical protein